jgi:hypothetical protein
MRLRSRLWLGTEIIEGDGVDAITLNERLCTGRLSTQHRIQKSRTDLDTILQARYRQGKGYIRTPHPILRNANSKVHFKLSNTRNPDRNE